MQLRYDHNACDVRDAGCNVLRFLPDGYASWRTRLGSGGRDEERKEQSRDLGRGNMALMFKRTPSSQRGTSLIELTMAMFVLAVGVLASAFLIPYSLGGNGRNKQQSHSTVIAQMIMEKITSAPASAGALNITDCSGAASNVNTTGSAGGTGSTLLASGTIDFSQALGSAGAPAGYYMQYTTCGTAGRQAMYDVRWNIQTPSSYVRLVTVSAKLSGTGNDLKYFSLPVTIRSMVGN